MGPDGWEEVLLECRDGLDAALFDLRVGVRHGRVDGVLDDVLFNVDRVRLYVSLVSDSMRLSGVEGSDV